MPSFPPFVWAWVGFFYSPLCLVTRGCRLNMTYQVADVTVRSYKNGLTVEYKDRIFCMRMSTIRATMHLYGAPNPKYPAKYVINSLGELDIFPEMPFYERLCAIIEQAFEERKNDYTRN